MLQQETPEDYVIATGNQHSVREFVDLAAGEVGIRIGWEGRGIDEKGYNRATGACIVAVDPLVGETMREDMKEAERDQLCKREGFATLERNE